MLGAGAENLGVPRVSLAILLVVVLAAGGCKRNPDAPPCGAVGATFLALSKDALSRATLDSDQDMRRAVEDQLPAMRDALVHACDDSKWSAAVRQCLVQAKDHVAFQACEQQLTDAQRQALDRSGAPEPTK